MAQDTLKLLLIEHDPEFSRHLGELLQKAPDLSAEIVSSQDLAGGLSALKNRNFDLVLLDLSVPDGAGLANISLIRSQTAGVPIIVTGDSDEQEVAIEAVHAGANDYIVKNHLSPGWLERSIRYALERHRIDSALLDAEAKYHSIFDHLVEGIFQTTPDGRYLMANAALARIYGYASPEELIEGLTDISHRLYVQEGRRDEFVRRMQAADTLTGFESQVYRKDGSVIWISENCRALRDAKGRLLYYEGTVEDITSRRNAEEQLQHSQSLYHSLVENLPQNVFRKDRDGRFTFGNQQFCRTLGLPLEAIVGKTDADFFPPALAAKYRRDDLSVLETGEAFETVEEHQPPGGGSFLYVQVVKTPVREADGRIIGLQGIFWDITRQRMADEEIRQANTALALSQEELRARNQQMEEDLLMACEIQTTMLPQTYPVFPKSGHGSASAFEFTHRYLPTASIGGDFFTISALSDSQVAVFLCDVAGHGVRASLITAMIRALVEELKPLATRPGDFLTKLNCDLCAILKHTGTPLLTTGIYIVADWQTGVLQYANAGHPKPLHIRRRARSVVPLSNASGRSQPALGLMAGISYQASEALLLPGDLLLLFTDGLIEAQSPSGELFSSDLLAAEVARRCDQKSNDLFDLLLSEVRRFAGGAAFADDVCMVGVDYC